MAVRIDEYGHIIRDGENNSQNNPSSMNNGNRQTSGSLQTSGSVVLTTPTRSQASRKARSIIKLLLVAIVLYSVIMYIAAKTAANDGDYEQAKHYMDLFPFYSSLFPGDYDNTSREAQRIVQERNSNTYNQAATYYRNGDYQEAYKLFNTLDSSYDQTSIYMDFCQAHIRQPSNYFSTIYNNIYFEDAKNLLMSDSDMFCKYMEGGWITNTSYGQQTVTVTDNGRGNYSMNGLPELPQGKMFYIRDGVLGYYDTAYVMWSDTDLFQIDIINETYFTLYSYQSGMTYYLSKEY